MIEPIDPQLVIDAQAGDEDAWRQILRRYGWAIGRAVRKAVRRKCDEDDALSMAHLTVFVCVRRYTPSNMDFECYLLRSLDRVWRRSANRGPIRVKSSYYRYAASFEAAARVQRSVSCSCVDSDGTEMGTRLGRCDDDPDERIDWVREAISTLNHRDRVIVEAWMLGEANHLTARVLGLSKSRVQQLQEQCLESAAQLVLERLRRRRIAAAESRLGALPVACVFPDEEHTVQRMEDLSPVDRLRNAISALGPDAMAKAVVRHARLRQGFGLELMRQLQASGEYSGFRKRCMSRSKSKQ